MGRADAVLSTRAAACLARLSENTYLAAVRAGMVSVVPLTIIGGLFLILLHLPAARWQATVEPYAPLLQIPVTATFGLLAVVACFFVAYDLGRRFGQEPAVSGSMAVVVFLMIQVDAATLTLSMDGLGSQGLFTGILVAVVTVKVQQLFTDRGIVIQMPQDVPAVVAQSFLSIVPFLFLVVAFWIVRFVIGVDINGAVQRAFSPLVFALSTLPGILVYALLVTMLWSVGINGDNALDAVVAPIFLQYLAVNVEAVTRGEPPPYVTAYGFFTTFVNVGGTGATIALALLLWRSRDPAFRKVGRLSLPTQIFQINEPIFFGLPIVLNPIFMVPYVLSALILTAGSYALMHLQIIGRPFVNVPWTTPPVIGHYLVTGGDLRAAVWGVMSILIAMVVYFPFARAAERRRAAAMLAPGGAGRGMKGER